MVGAEVASTGLRRLRWAKWALELGRAMVVRLAMGTGQPPILTLIRLR